MKPHNGAHRGLPMSNGESSARKPVGNLWHGSSRNDRGRWGFFFFFVLVFVFCFFTKRKLPCWYFQIKRRWGVSRQSEDQTEWRSKRQICISVSHGVHPPPVRSSGCNGPTPWQSVRLMAVGLMWFHWPLWIKSEQFGGENVNTDWIPPVQVISFHGCKHPRLQGQTCHGDGQLLNVRWVLQGISTY